MNPPIGENNESVEELPDSWWHKVYLGVVIATIAVITVLWSFSRYFS